MDDEAHYDLTFRARTQPLSVGANSQFLAPAEGARDRGNHCDGKQPAQDVEPDRYRERCSLGIKVAGLAERRRGDQHIEGVQRGVEFRARARAHWHGMTSAENQPSGNERTCQQQHGAARRIPVPSEQIL